MRSARVLWEKDFDPQVLTKRSLERSPQKVFERNQSLFAAYLNRSSGICVLQRPEAVFQSPFRACIQTTQTRTQLEHCGKRCCFLALMLFIGG